MARVNSSVIKKSFPVAYDIMKTKKIHKASVEVRGSFHISEDCSYTLVAPNGEQKSVRIGGEFGGHTNTGYINNQYDVPKGYYAVETQLFLGKWMVTVYTPDQSKLEAK